MKKLFIIIILVTSFIIFNPSLSESQSINLEGIEYFIGFSQSKLTSKEDYYTMPFIVDLDFNIRSLAEDWGFDTLNLVQLQVEPFFSFVTEPDENIETGASVFLKLGLAPEYSALQPYIKGGTGIVYMSQHTKEQGSQFNFITSFGVGLHYFFDVDNAFTVEYRFRHLSNCSIKKPNITVCWNSLSDEAHLLVLVCL